MGKTFVNEIKNAIPSVFLKGGIGALLQNRINLRKIKD